MIRRFAAFALLALVLAIGLPSHAQDKSSGVLLNAEDLKKLVEPSLLISGRNAPYSISFSALFLRGGLVHLLTTEIPGTGSTEKGKWRLDGDKFCVAYPDRALGPSEEQCRHHYRLPDGSYEARLVPGEKLQFTYRTVNK